MNEILSTLASFASSKDSRLACAAAVILAELAPKDSAVTRQLSEALNHADAVRRPFIIEALGRIGTADAAAALAPLIKADGPASEQALRAIAHTASAALKPLLGLIGSVPPALLERVAECVARTGETVAFSSLLNALNGADVDVCRAIRAGLRAAMTSFDAKPKEQLRKQLEKAFADKNFVQHHPALIAIMKIAGDLGDVSFQKVLAAHVAPDYPPHVRRAALQAIGKLHLSGEQRARLAPLILPLMLENDANNLSDTALEALRQAHLTSEHQPMLRKLVNSQSSRIREFAMQNMAAQGNSRTIHELIACLESPERGLRDEALGALSRTPASAEPLAERILRQDGTELVTETARALSPQAAHIPKKLLEKLAEQYVALVAGTRETPLSLEAFQKGAEKRRAILNIFRAGNSPLLVECAYERARQLREQDEPGRACELLKGVSGLNGWNDEYRIEMALAGLCASPKDLARAARAIDGNLRIFEEVLSSGHKTAAALSKKLQKDASISRKTLYYLGFHFAERMHAEREFGKLVLEHLATSRTEDGKQAREKLVLEGMVTGSGSKSGILEERAKVLMSVTEIAAIEPPAHKESVKMSTNGTAKKAKSNAAKVPGKAPERTKSQNRETAKTLSASKGKGRKNSKAKSAK